MISRLMDWWEDRSFWVQCSIGVALFYCVVAVFRVSGESRPVGGFAEEVVAMFIADASLIGAFVGGIASGIFVAKKLPKQAWVGWVVGLIAFGAIGSVRYLAEGIPGVGWRIAQMNDAEPVEY